SPPPSGPAPAAAPPGWWQRPRPAAAGPWGEAPRRTARQAGSAWSYRSCSCGGFFDLLDPRARCQRKAQALAAVVIALRHGARQGADAADVGGALGHGNGAARVQQVEGVGGLEHLLIGRQRQ